MMRAASVVTREDGLKANHTIFVARLNTSEKGGIDVILIRGITVAAGHNTGVNTLFSLQLVLLLDHHLICNGNRLTVALQCHKSM
jgi:hypothetical protein